MIVSAGKVIYTGKAFFGRWELKAIDTEEPKEPLMKKIIIAMCGFVLMASQSFFSANAAWNPDKKEKTDDQAVEQTIAAFLEKDPGMQKFLDEAHGYVVFPKIYKGAIGVGGAYGAGQVYEGGKYIGNATLAQLTYGLQLGGQAYAEIIFFGDKDALERFKAEKLEFSAQASAVAADAGAAATAAYEGGVAVFTLAIGGLMYEASIGGQKFEFEPAE